MTAEILAKGVIFIEGMLGPIGQDKIEKKKKVLKGVVKVKNPKQGQKREQMTRAES
jgi:hypothetical protein